MANRGIQPLLLALRAKLKILRYSELTTIPAESSENLQASYTSTTSRLNIYSVKNTTKIQWEFKANINIRPEIDRGRN